MIETIDTDFDIQGWGEEEMKENNVVVNVEDGTDYHLAFHDKESSKLEDSFSSLTISKYKYKFFSIFLMFRKSYMLNKEMIVICRCKVPMTLKSSSNNKHFGLYCGNSGMRKGFCRTYIDLEDEEIFVCLREDNGI